MKHNDKALRFKYIRVLEKFVKRTIALIKNENFNYEVFKEQVDTNYEDIKSVKPVRLDSQYLLKLQAYAQMTIDFLDHHTGDFQKERDTLLKEANLLHKEKNKNNYKKDKHRKKNFNDGY
jgi:hypothetical protein